MSRRNKYILSLLFVVALFIHPFNIGRELTITGRGKTSSQEVFDKNGSLLRLTLSEDGQYRQWTQLKDIPDTLKDAFLFKEDQYFYYHPGVNPISLLRSALQLMTRGKSNSGGSTITMQLARLISKRRTKTILGKLIQVIEALKLETLYTKDQILEAYLNITPYGRNIQGVSSAARIYFKKEIKELTSFEVTILASLPQRPGLLNKLKKRSLLPEKIRISAGRLYKGLAAFHPFFNNLDAINRSFVIHSISDLPFRAPHFVNYVLNKEIRGKINTSLDFKIQKILERTLRDYVQLNKKKGIDNASVFLVNYEEMKIEAMLGSADFFNNDIDGQVNGIFSQRSPGSTLKPFIYALALQEGLIHPSSMLFDAPLTFRTPENFDNIFKGPMSATDALITSRNVPAVYLASRVSRPSFFSFLKQLYPGKFEQTNNYGSSLALGGKEFSVFEIAKLYSMLANRGRFHEISYLNKKEKNHGLVALKEAPVSLLMQMLAKFERPGLSNQQSFVVNDFPVYWKTGTSFGFRDAWASGIFGPYVLVVWVGDFRGAGNPNLIGSSAAGPLFFNIVDRMKQFLPQYVHDTHQFQDDLREVKVCSLTGGFPNRNCPHIKKTMIWPGVSPIKKCRVHRLVKVVENSGLQACYAYKGKYIGKVMEIWPSHILEVFKKGGLARIRPPELHPSCLGKKDSTLGFHPKILTPHRGLTYTFRSEEKLSENNKIIFKATGDGATYRLHWFVDGKYLGASKKDEPLIWKSRPGKFTVKVLDDYGREGRRELFVKEI